MATTRGIDLSVYQNAQDWAARKREGVSFVIAKASEGQHSQDEHFGLHIRGARSWGMLVGGYHFAWPNQDPHREAANYAGAVRQQATGFRDFMHWLDLERYQDGRNYRGRSAAQILAWVKTWLADVRAAYPGHRVGVYTSGSDLAAGHCPAGVPLWYPAYPWGEASYARAESAARPSPSGRAPLLWQFTSTPLDRNIAYMSASDLRAWVYGGEDDEMALTEAQTYKATWEQDTWPAPADRSDQTNKNWTPRTFALDTNAKARATASAVERIERALTGSGGVEGPPSILDRLTALETRVQRLEEGR